MLVSKGEFEQFYFFAGVGVEPTSQGYEPCEISVSLPRVLHNGIIP